MHSLNEFVESTMTEINRIAHILNWDADSLKSADECCVCPYDSSHRIPKTSLDKHLAPCRWKTEGYQESDLPLSQPVSIDKFSSIRFDQSLQAQILENSLKMECAASMDRYSSIVRTVLSATILPLIIGLAQHLIPRTSDRLLTNFTCQERRALYEYAIANTVKPDIGQDLADSHDGMAQSANEKELSYLEVLAQERNMKRRRAKHKGVHTNKKSHTEILREVINQQMEIYMEHMGDNTDDSSSFGKLERTRHIDPEPREGTQEQQQYSPQILSNPENAHQSSSITKKCEQYHSGMARYGIRFQDQHKPLRYLLGEREEEGNVCSRRRHSHHEEKKKWTHFHHRDSSEDSSHRSKHESHKEKNRKCGKGEGSYERHYSHHTRRDRRFDREKEKNRD